VGGGLEGELKFDSALKTNLEGEEGSGKCGRTFYFRPPAQTKVEWEAVYFYFRPPPEARVEWDREGVKRGRRVEGNKVTRCFDNVKTSHAEQPRYIVNGKREGAVVDW